GTVFDLTDGVKWSSSQRESLSSAIPTVWNLGSTLISTGTATVTAAWRPGEEGGASRPACTRRRGTSFQKKLSALYPYMISCRGRFFSACVGIPGIPGEVTCFILY